MKQHYRLPIVLGLVLALGASVTIAQTDDFAALMDAAMTRMHAAMMTTPPSGDPDRDFAAMMIPHHQGAIDMAEAELRFGHDERLRRLAQGILVEQRQEIAVMRAILAEHGYAPVPVPVPASAPAPSPASTSGHGLHQAP